MFVLVTMACLTTFAKQAHAQTVTFEQIIENPDNAALNLRFAKQEIAKGRLQQAASALERLLLNNPNLDTVRFLYGVLLLRMDDLEGAKREFSLLEGRNLPSNLEADRRRYMGQINHASAPVRVSGQVVLGGRVDSNPGLVSDRIANATVENGIIVGPDLLNPIDGMNDGSDVGFVSRSRLRIEGDIDRAPGSTWFVQLDGNFQEFVNVDRSDAFTGNAKIGVNLTNDLLALTPYFKAGQTDLQSDAFNRRWGAGVDINYRFSPVLKFFANVEYLTEDYQNTPSSITNEQRDGDLISGYLGASYRVNEGQTVSLSVFAADKEADVNPGFSYEQVGIAFGAVQLLGKGAYTTLGMRYSEVEFDQPDGIATSPFNLIQRSDERFYARLATGAPLKTVSEALQLENPLPNFLEDVVVELGVSFSTLGSTSNLVEYDNVSGEILFKKKFNF